MASYRGCWLRLSMATSTSPAGISKSFPCIRCLLTLMLPAMWIFSTDTHPMVFSKLAYCMNSALKPLEVFPVTLFMLCNVLMN